MMCIILLKANQPKGTKWLSIFTTFYKSEPERLYTLIVRFYQWKSSVLYHNHWKIVWEEEKKVWANIICLVDQQHVKHPRSKRSAHIQTKQTIGCDISISNKCFSFGYLYRFKVILAIKLTFPCTHLTFDLSASVFRAVHHCENTHLRHVLASSVSYTQQTEEVKQHMRQISDEILCICFCVTLCHSQFDSVYQQQ